MEKVLDFTLRQLKFRVCKDSEVFIDDTLRNEGPDEFLLPKRSKTRGCTSKQQSRDKDVGIDYNLNYLDRAHCIASATQSSPSPRSVIFR